MTEQVNTRKFSVSPHIIYSLIKAQAGTLAKGVLECIMNSVDAGAKSITVQLDKNSLVVTDDGKGFQSRTEIEACFEVFGFEHHEGDRTYGQFGIGRAQLWNFCSTVWHTNGFRMDVDIKNRGLDYDLVENAQPFQGLRIEGKFYEPMSTSEILACERELKDLATYVNIPVTFNGERISKDPRKQKWTHETDEAWVQLSSVSRTLTVYNLGVRVREYPSYQFGCGGLVVTKPGVRLALNMARNDILVAECGIWRKIKPFLQGKTDEAVKRSKRLTEEQLANLATRFLAGEIPYSDVAERKLIGDVLGGKHTLKDFLDKAWRSADKTVTYAPKNDAGPSAEESHKHSYCFVLDHKTLTRFGTRSLEDFMRKLEEALDGRGVGDIVLRYPNSRWNDKGPAARLVVAEEWRKACKRVTEGYQEVAHKDWSKREMAAMSSLRAASETIVRLLRECGIVEADLRERELRVGVSEVAQAWTDGTALIWLNRTLIAQLDHGLGGVLRVVGTLVHEYLHEAPSSGTHVHDDDFYERFHQAMLFQTRWGRTLGDVVEYVLSDYMKECSKRGVPVKSRVSRATDKAEAFAVAA